MSNILQRYHIADHISYDDIMYVYRWLKVCRAIMKRGRFIRPAMQLGCGGAIDSSAN